MTLWLNDLGLWQTEPVLQPLIGLDRRNYAIAPFLWIGSAAERNWTVLMNALTSEKVVYSDLVNNKEALMRKRIADSLPAQYRTGNCKIPGRSDLPDIDLAIIDDFNKICFIVELKWFINPAEVREISEKSNEIEKGVSQLLKIKAALTKNPNLLDEPLAISNEYRVEVLLISANWIGYEWVQDSRVPVVNEAHFTKKVAGSSSLNDVAAWLKERRYLPVENTHYKLTNNTAVLGRWRLFWRGIETLSDLGM